MIKSTCGSPRGRRFEGLCRDAADVSELLLADSKYSSSLARDEAPPRYLSVEFWGRRIQYIPLNDPLNHHYDRFLTSPRLLMVELLSLCHRQCGCLLIILGFPDLERRHIWRSNNFFHFGRLRGHLFYRPRVINLYQQCERGTKR